MIAAPGSVGGGGPTTNNEDEFLKLQLDLAVVMEKVRLCREILQISPGIHQDEALADVIGFLEAVRDRMVDIIEAGTQGLLGEDLFALALKVNDAVLRTLEAEKVIIFVYYYFIYYYLFYNHIRTVYQLQLTMKTKMERQ
jgi:hypothetical protein